MTEYDDDYPTCDQSYATLRILSEAVDPDVMSARLGIAASRAHRRGDRGSGRAIHGLNGWFLTTEEIVQSRDVRRHIDWLLERMDPLRAALASLRAEGCRADIFCFWVSASGHGGPGLMPGSMRRLADLELEVWFDVYFRGSDEPADEAP